MLSARIRFVLVSSASLWSNDKGIVSFFSSGCVCGLVVVLVVVLVCVFVVVVVSVLVGFRRAKITRESPAMAHTTADGVIITTHAVVPESPPSSKPAPENRHRRCGGTTWRWCCCCCCEEAGEADPSPVSVALVVGALVDGWYGVLTSGWSFPRTAKATS